jgi:secreted PhoX family phosphatase
VLTLARRGVGLRNATREKGADQMTLMDRRTFLNRGAAVAGAGLFSAGAVEALGNRAALATSKRGSGSPYGPLFPARDRSTGREILALPRGFRYVTFGYIGSKMSDGNITPLALDGMAAFRHPTDHRLVRLIRNHEDRNAQGAGSNPVAPDEASEVYDATAGGGTSTLDFDPRSNRLVQDFISLKGTIVNCAGGHAYDYAGWITGEEAVSTFGERHGYNFFVPVDRGPRDSKGGEPIVPMGRFSHEAVATDQRTGIVYQTDDPGSGVGAGFYRYIPRRPRNLYAGGSLQMLGIAGRPQADLREGQTVRAVLPVRWFDIEDVDPDAADNRQPTSVYRQGYDQGGAQFNRLEGCWWDGRGSIYFASTSGGDVKNGDVNADGYAEGYGQIWRYRASRHGGDLTLIYQSDGAEALDSPDNLCVTPRGGLILCEDDASSDSDLNRNAPGISDVNRLIGYGRDGRVFEFAVNRLNDSEFAGATFSPDGGTLFVNIFGDSAGTPSPYTGNEGMTIAVSGPWNRGPL